MGAVRMHKVGKGRKGMGIRVAEGRSVRSLPKSLSEVAFDEPATVVFASAEGVTMFPGVDGDPDESGTRKWIQDELARPVDIKRV